jgi:hypothetical protein
MTAQRARLALFSSLVAFFVLVAPGVSWSQTPEEIAGARAAATAGLEAFDAGKWSEAEDFLKRAESLVHSPVHLLYMARSQVKLGKLVRARENYIKVTAEDVSKAHEAIREAQAEAEKELEALEPRLAYISVVVQGGAGKEVRAVMDGSDIPPALLGVPRPVDPGEHEFQALADGMSSSGTKVKVGEGGSETVVLTLRNDPNAKLGRPTAEGGQPQPTDAAPADQGPAPPPKEESSILPVIGWISLGVGVVGVAAGTIFMLQGKSKVSDANDICSLPNDECPESRRAAVEDLDDGARSANTLSTVGFIVGGVGVATGVTLLLVGSSGGGSSGEEAARPHVRPRVGLGWAGVSGAF